MWWWRGETSIICWTTMHACGGTTTWDQRNHAGSNNLRGKTHLIEVETTPPRQTKKQLQFSSSFSAEWMQQDYNKAPFGRPTALASQGVSV
jgi:hypothetical protein